MCKFYHYIVRDRAAPSYLVAYDASQCISLFVIPRPALTYRSAPMLCCTLCNYTNSAPFHTHVLSPQLGRIYQCVYLVSTAQCPGGTVLFERTTGKAFRPDGAGQGDRQTVGRTPSRPALQDCVSRCHRSERCHAFTRGESQ